MKTFRFLLFPCFAAVCLAQPVIPAPQIFPQIPDDSVLAVFDDGVKFTMHDFRGLYTVMNSQMQQGALQNRKGWLEQYALFRKLALMAEKDGLDKESPTKEALEFNRMLVLSQVKLNASMNSAVVDGPEIIKAYEANKERYKQVQVKVIYVSFVSAALAQSTGQKGLTEAQAREKAEKLVAQIRAGADFTKLVKENSDDQTSAQKGGDFGTLRRTDNIPDAVRNAVFALSKGQVSDPVRQSNGFYILKAEDISYRPLVEVRDEVYTEVKTQHHQEWLANTREQTKVKIVNEAFLTASPGAAATPPAPPSVPPAAPKTK